MLLSKMSLNMLKEVAIVVGGCNLGGYVMTACLETHKITDLVGVGSFVVAVGSLSYRNGLLQNFKTVLSSVDFNNNNKLNVLMKLIGNNVIVRQMLVNVSIAIWGSRLASYLFNRVLQLGEDKRLNKVIIVIIIYYYYYYYYYYIIIIINSFIVSLENLILISQSPFIL